MFVDDVPREGAVMFIARGDAMDAPGTFARALTASARGIARSERCEAIGLTLAMKGGTKGTLAVPMTRPCEEAWSRMESATTAARWTTTTTRIETRDEEDEDALRDALRVGILSLSCYRGCDEKNVVLVSRRPIRLSGETIGHIAKARAKAGVRVHVIRSVDGVDSSPDEKAAMCRLVRCDETGGCLSSSLGCCFECGLTVGVKADFALPDDLTNIGLLRERNGEDHDGDDGEKDALSSSQMSIVHSPGCRDEHAEFRDIPDAELEQRRRRRRA